MPSARLLSDWWDEGQAQQGGGNLSSLRRVSQLEESVGGGVVARETDFARVAVAEEMFELGVGEGVMQREIDIARVSIVESNF